MTDHQRTIAALVLAGILSLGLGGCGKKGPLYLPDEAAGEAVRAIVRR
jgi:predicted small lipoprotein YifL